MSYHPLPTEMKAQQEAMRRTSHKRASILLKENPYEVVKIARSNTVRAVNVLIAMLNDEEQPGAVRVRCAEIILDRGWGKAPQQLVVSEGESGLAVSGMSIFEKIAAIKNASDSTEGTIELEASALVPAPQQPVEEAHAEVSPDPRDFI
jgi:hypothetical protein